jgi:phenylacetate-CoA ligase
MTRDRVRQEGHRLLADNARRLRTRRYATSGTSGQPLAIYLDRSANTLEFVYYWRHWGWAGYRLGDRFAELNTTYFLRRSRQTPPPWVWQPSLRRLLLDSASISVDAACELADALRRHRPRFLKGLASSLSALATTFEESGIDDISFQAVFSTGEVVSPPCRQLVVRVFGCPLLDSFGHMERTVAVSQCPRGSYHVNWDYGLLEVEDVREAPGGTTRLGRIVGTSLHNLAMPLLRYDVGDDIELFAEPRDCPCGRTLPVIRAVHGRSEDTLVTPDGRFLTSLFVTAELVDGIRLIQFVRLADGLLEIRVVPAPGWDASREEQLLGYVGRLAGPAMRLRLVQVTSDELIRDPSGKRRTVIAHPPPVSTAAR